MPQMKPLNWMNLFLIFSLIILIMNLMNFYIFSSNPSTINSSLNKCNCLNNLWKW